jgi:hypothetical protein
MSRARIELRKHFYEQRNVSDATQLASLSHDVDDIEEILRHRIVQAVKNEKGNFGKPNRSVMFDVLILLC